jgi:hypothetical protein
LAWRFYVVFGKQKWALYLPAVAVMMNTCEFSSSLLVFDLIHSMRIVLCWSADFQHLGFYVNKELYENTLLPVTLDITVAWGWFIFTNNTLMTGGILYKIM